MSGEKLENKGMSKPNFALVLEEIVEKGGCTEHRCGYKETGNKSKQQL